jgi:hypothetical protein
VRLPREGLWFETNTRGLGEVAAVHVVEFVEHESRYGNSLALTWCVDCGVHVYLAKHRLVPLTPAARELLKLDWSAL